MLNINSSIVAGIVGNEIDIRYKENGMPYCHFIVGTSDEEVDENGNLQPITEWHRCFAEGDIAIKLETEAQKGASIYVSGKSKTKFFEEGVGLHQQVTEVWADSIQVASGGKAAAEDLDKVLREALDNEDIPY
jgi:single-strand DNA-binding protein